MLCLYIVFDVYVHIFDDLVKRRVLTLVREVPSYSTDRYCYLYSLSSSENVRQYLV